MFCVKIILGEIMKERNYDEFDYLRILVREELFDEVLLSYSCFGWEVHEMKNSSVFLETKEIVLKRKHKIKNKDKLQLYQVYMENDYSTLGKLRKNKYKKSTILGLFVGLLATLIVCCSISLAVKSLMTLGLVLGIILTVLGSLVLVRLLFALRVLKKIEDANFEKNRLKIVLEIKKICSESKILTQEGGNGKN